MLHVGRAESIILHSSFVVVVGRLTEGSELSRLRMLKHQTRPSRSLKPQASRLLYSLKAISCLPIRHILLTFTDAQRHSQKASMASLVRAGKRGQSMSPQTLRQRFMLYISSHWSTHAHNHSQRPSSLVAFPFKTGCDSRFRYPPELLMSYIMPYGQAWTPAMPRTSEPSYNIQFNVSNSD